MPEVGKLWVSLGIKKEHSLDAASGWLSGLGKLAAMGGAFFGIKSLGKAMFGLNAELQTGTVQLAGMMAIVRKTPVADQMNEAAAAVERLSKRTTELPGTLKDYITLEKQIALPLMKAGASLQDLEDIAVSTMTAMKIKDVDVGTASRTIMRIMNGNALAKDRVAVFYADMLGMSVKELNALAKVDKAKVRRLLLDKKIHNFATDYNKEQNKTFAGQKEELGERAGRFFARIGKGIFDNALGGLTKINEWLKANDDKINAFADSISRTLVGAFEFLGDVIKWLWENSEQVEDVLYTIAIIIGGVLLKNTLLWMRAWGPLLLLVWGAVKLFKFLRQYVGDVGAAIITALAVGGAVYLFNKNIRKAVNGVYDLVKAFIKARIAKQAMAGGTIPTGLGGGGPGASSTWMMGQYGPNKPGWKSKVGSGIGAVAGAYGPAAMAAGGFDAVTAIKDRNKDPHGLVNAIDEIAPWASVLISDEMRSFTQTLSDRTSAHGEMTLGGMYADMVRVGKGGQYDADSFGRGEPAPVINQTNNITLNVADKEDMVNTTTEEMDKVLRQITASLPGGKK